MKPSVAVKIIVAIYLVGLLGFTLNLKFGDVTLYQFFSTLTPANIVFSFLFLLFFHKDWSFRFVISMLIIASIGFWVEYLGVKTGLLFGRYSYGSNLGLKFLDIPVIKGVNWFLLIYCSRAWVQKWVRNPVILSVLASLIMVIYDYVLEPFAMNTDLWNWNIGVPPLHNFAGWLLVSLLIHLAYSSSEKQVHNPIAVPLFVVQFVFFALIGIIKGWLPYIPG